MDELNTYKVYIRIDGKNRVVEINSSAFIEDTAHWIEIDEGEGYKYHHAQGNYLPERITDENGVYRYKYENGEVVKRSAEEMAADMPEPEPSLEEKLAEQEATIATLTECILEMSEYVYS